MSLEYSLILHKKSNFNSSPIQGDPEQWRTVLLLTSGVFLFGWLFYVAFASAEEAEWSKSGREVDSKAKNFSSDIATVEVIETATTIQLPTWGQTEKIKFTKLEI